MSHRNWRALPVALAALLAVGCLFILGTRPASPKNDGTVLAPSTAPNPMAPPGIASPPEPRKHRLLRSNGSDGPERKEQLTRQLNDALLESISGSSVELRAPEAGDAARDDPSQVFELISMPIFRCMRRAKAGSRIEGEFELTLELDESGLVDAWLDADVEVIPIEILECSADVVWGAEWPQGHSAQLVTFPFRVNAPGGGEP